MPAIAGYKGPLTTSAAYVARLQEMVERSGAGLVIVLPDLEAALRQALAATGCRVLAATAGATPGAEDDFSPGQGEALAYLQFTSGTTGLQKGVRLSHRAILNQVQALKKCFQLGRRDVVVNWLPLYHDFGLFAGFVMPLLCAVPGILLSPFHWLRDPAALLRLIQRHRGTVSLSPIPPCTTPFAAWAGVICRGSISLPSGSWSTVPNPCSTRASRCSWSASLPTASGKPLSASATAWPKTPWGRPAAG